MVDFEQILKKDELAVYVLRDLYGQYGYKRFKTGKFEEYELYARNKDFLGSDGILTFTDSKGRLRALKPDVTISIAKNTTEAPGLVQKFCYDEYVYRLSRGSGSFREILQTGIECIGDLTYKEISEVITLAVRSLECIADDYVLNISHMGIVKGVTALLNLPAEAEDGVLRCIGDKNFHGAAAICRENGVSEDMVERLGELISSYGSISEVLEKTEKFVLNSTIRRAVDELRLIGNVLKAEGLGDKVRFDFSVVNDMGYYNGVIFQGFVNGIAAAVLSGGRYDNLMIKMGKKSGAIGFSVNLDLLEDLERAEDEAAPAEGGRTINIALPKGRLGNQVYEMFAAVGFDCPEFGEKSRKLIFSNDEKNLRFFWVKPSDVAIYVERGVADIGVVGQDVLLETNPDVYELLDMNCGICRMMVAAKKTWEDDTDGTLRVATKYPNIAARYYAGKSRDIDIIKLNGSIEIAPILGLSDVIVDIVETGNTLKANNLEVKENIAPISARLIANKASFMFKTEEIETVKTGLSEQVEKED